MSNTIDDKVVRISFDNAQFERNAQKTMGTLDKLKSKLNFNDAEKTANSAFSKIQDALKKTEVLGYEAGFHIADVFKKMSSVFEYQVANKIINLGEKMVAAVTIDPLKTGWSEFELKTNSVRTIMSATGESIEKVTEYLDELNEYSDRTIYSFQDMTSNIGKFTNAGVSLDDAVKAMKGISNEAAISGANANEASRAMYNLAQALSMGYVQYIDWKSIENANMATVDFKKNIAETAVEMGVLSKTADGDFKTAAGKVYTLQQLFKDAMKEQWFTNDVLLKVLGNYADETTEIGRKGYEAAGKVTTFSKAIDTLKESFQSGWAKSWELFFGNIEEATVLWTKLSDVITDAFSKIDDSRNNFIQKLMYDAGGRYVMYETLDSLATTAATIVGPISEAFKLMIPEKTVSELNTLLAIFLRHVRALQLTKEEQQLLKVTTMTLISAFKDMASTASNVISIFTGVTPKFEDARKTFLKVASVMAFLVKRFTDFIARSGAVEAVAIALRNGLLKLANAVLDIVLNILSNEGVVNVISSIVNAFKSFIGLLAQINDLSFGEFITGLGDIFKTFYESSGIVGTVVNTIIKAFDRLFSFFKIKRKDPVITETVGSFQTEVINPIFNAVEQAKNATGTLDKIKAAFSGAFTALGNLGALIQNKIASVFHFFAYIDFANVIKFGAVIAALYELHKITKKLFYIPSILDTISNGFREIADTVKGKFKADAIAAKAEAIKSIAIAVGILSASVVALSFIEPKKLWATIGAIVVLGTVVTALAIAFARFSEAKSDGVEDKVKEITGFKDVLGMLGETLKKIGTAAMIAGVAVALVGVAVALGILVKAFTSFPTTEDWNAFGKKFGQFAIFFGSFILAIAVLGHAVKGAGPAILSSAVFMLALVSVMNTLLSVLEKFYDLIYGEKGMGLYKADVILKRLAKIFVYLTGGLAVLSVAMNSFGGSGVGLGFAGAAAFLLATMVFLTNLSDILVKFHEIRTIVDSRDWLTLGGALLAIVGVVTALSLSVGAAGPGMLAAAVAMLAFIAVLRTLASTLKKLSSADLGKIQNSLGELGRGLIAVVAAIAIIGAVMGHVGAGAGLTLLAFSAVILSLVASLTVLQFLDISKIKDVALVLGGIMLALSAPLLAASLFGKGSAGAVRNFAAVLLVLVGGLAILTFLDIARIQKITTDLVVIMGAMALVFASTKLAAKSTGAIGAFAGVLFVLVAGLAVLSFIDIAKLQQATESIVAVLLAIIPAMILSSKLGKGSVAGILSFTALLGVLVGALGVFSTMNISGLRQSAISLSGVILALTTSLAAASLNKSAASWKVVAAMVPLILSVAGAIALINMGSVEGAKTAALLLGGLLLVVTGVTAIAAHIDGTKTLGVVKQLIAIILSLAILGGAVSLIDDPSGAAKTFLALGGLLLVITGVIAIIDKFQLSLAYNQVLSLLSVIASLSLLVSVISYIDDPAGAASLVESLSFMLLAVTAMIAILDKTNASLSIPQALSIVALMGVMALFGAAVGMIPNPVGTASLIESLTVALIAVSGVVAILGKLQIGLMEGVKAALALVGFAGVLGAVVLAFNGLDNLFGGAISGGITEGITKMAEGLGTAIGSFKGAMQKAEMEQTLAMSDDLTAFAEKLGPLSDILSGVNTEGITGVMAAANMLSEFASSIPNSGGIIADFFGDNDLATFSNELVQFGTCMSLFGLTIKNVDTDQVTAAATAASLLAEFANALPNEGGVLAYWLGDNTLTSFANGLVEFAHPFVNFATAISNGEIKWDIVEKSGVAAKALAEFANALPNEGGILAKITGENSLSVFADELAKFAPNFVSYANRVATISDWDAVSNSALAAKALTEFGATIPNSGGFISKLTGENSLSQFGEEISKWGRSFSEYCSYISGVSDFDKVKESATAAAALCKFAAEIPNSGGFISSLTGDNSLAKFGGELEIFGGHLKVYADHVAEISDTGKLYSTTATIERIANMAATVDKMSGGYANLAALTRFGTSLSEFGPQLFGYASNVVSIDTVKMDAVSASIVTLINSIKNLDGYSGGSFTALVEDLKGAAETGITNFLETFSTANTEVSVAVAGFMGSVVNSFESVGIYNRLMEAAKLWFSAVQAGVEAKCTNLKIYVQNFLTNLPSSISVPTVQLQGVGEELINGVIVGVSSRRQALYAEVSSIMKGIPPLMQKVIHDPEKDGLSYSADTKPTGEEIINGLIVGENEAAPNLYNNTAKIMQSTANVITGKEQVNGIKGKIGGVIDQLDGYTGGKLSAFLSNAREYGKEAGFDYNNFYHTVKETTKSGTKDVVNTVEQGQKAATQAAKSGKSERTSAAKAEAKETLTIEDQYWAALLEKKKKGAEAEKYADMKVKDFEKQILQETTNLVKTYTDALDNSTKQMMGMIGLFDKVEEKAEDTGETFNDIFKSISDDSSKTTRKIEGKIDDLFARVETVTSNGSKTAQITGDELMANLQDQIDKYTEYYDIQDELAKRIDNKKLKKTLHDMTIDSINELKALNAMSDEELEDYVKLFEDRVELAKRGKEKDEEEEDKPTAESLTKNLEDQVEKYKEYQEVITSLNSKITSKELRNTLNEMGIDNLDQLKVLESMTDSELSKYTALFEEKYQISKDTAHTKLKDTREDTEKQLNELLGTTGIQLDEFVKHFDNTLKSLTDIVTGKFQTNSLGNSVGHMAQQLINILLGVFNEAGVAADQKVEQIRKSLENAAALGIDISDQYSQGIQLILNNTEMSADDKLKGILQLMMDSQVSLAKSSENLAESTKKTIEKILSDAEAAKLVRSLMSTLNSGVETAEKKIELFKQAIQTAGETNVQLTDNFRIRIAELLAQTNVDADTQITALLDILKEATAQYEGWAVQDIGLLTADLATMLATSQQTVNSAAKVNHDSIKKALSDTTNASGDELEKLTNDVESAIKDVGDNGVSAVDSVGDAVEGIVGRIDGATTEMVDNAKNAIVDLISQATIAQAKLDALGSEGSDDEDERDSRDPIGMWETAAGHTLTEAQREFAKNGGAIVGAGGSQVIKDGRYWNQVEKTSYDLASGAASYALDGFTETMEKGMERVRETGSAAYHAFSDGFTGPEGLDENSPSKRMIEFARYAILGWVNGVSHYSNLITQSGADSADSYVDIFNETIQNLDVPDDMSPVITPIIDLSRVKESMDALDNLFNTEKSYAMASDIKKAADLAARSRAEASRNTAQPAQKTTVQNFTQNNYSPKALSKLDIYRQTKNQFAQMKGALA